MTKSIEIRDAHEHNLRHVNLSIPRGSIVMAPIVQERKGEYRKELAELKENGFVRARVDGTTFLLSGFGNRSRL